MALRAQHSAQRDRTGVMLALYPSAEVARKLAVPGGEDPAELHLTLCYLGSADDFQPTALVNLPGKIGEVAARCTDLEGSISGWGCFAPSDRTEGQEVLWAAVDVPGLAELREELAKVCAEMGAPPVDAHSYQPHITLAYRKPGSGKVPALDRIPIRFDSVYFVRGEKRTRIPLSAPAAQKMERDSEVPATDVWDCALIFGQYQHVTVDDKPVVNLFDASSCRFMLDDFASRKNDLFLDKRHEVVDARNDAGKPLDLDELDLWARGTTGSYGYAEGDGRALAWYDALVMVVGGQVVKYVCHATAPTNPPTTDDLRRSDGSLPEDGVYARRSTVTPLGADPKEGLPVYRYTSPYFVPMRDGYRLLNLTATNDPRMEGVALAYERGGRVAMQRIKRPARSAMENAMAKMEEDKGAAPDQGHAAIMKLAGCAESDSPEDKVAKMAAYVSKMEEARKAEDARKNEEMEDESEEDKPAKAAVKEARKAARGKAEAEPFAGKEDAQEESAENAALIERIEALEEKNAMLLKELADSRGAMQRFRKMEEKTKAQEAATFARSAVAMGRIKGDHKGSLEATESWLAARFLKSEADAEDLLSAEGTFQVSERVAMTRYTSGGAGIGAPAPRADLSPSDEVDALVQKEIKALQAEGSKEKDLTSVAMSRVSKKHPAAWGRYVNRNRAA